jgi:hypothetical protein
MDPAVDITLGWMGWRTATSRLARTGSLGALGWWTHGVVSSPVLRRGSERRFVGAHISRPDREVDSGVGAANGPREGSKLLWTFLVQIVNNPYRFVHSACIDRA